MGGRLVVVSYWEKSSLSQPSDDFLVRLSALSYRSRALNYFLVEDRTGFLERPSNCYCRRRGQLIRDVCDAAGGQPGGFFSCGRGDNLVRNGSCANDAATPP